MSSEDDVEVVEAELAEAEVVAVIDSEEEMDFGEGDQDESASPVQQPQGNRPQTEVLQVTESYPRSTVAPVASTSASTSPQPRRKRKSEEDDKEGKRKCNRGKINLKGRKGQFELLFILFNRVIRNRAAASRAPRR
jgi:hypothetical protein